MGAKTKQQLVPEVGKFYHFWDDGKTSPSRHYICRVEELITIAKAKEISFNRGEEIMTLYDIWQEEINSHRQGTNFTVLSKGADTKPGSPWLYAEDTDFFVRISCPCYDDNDLWAVRTVDGGWFTMDVQSCWQSGTLDVTGEIYDDVIAYYESNGYDTYDYTSTTYEKK